jgi:hypothetical protein
MRVACPAVLALLAVSAGTSVASPPSHCTGPALRATLVTFSASLNRGDFAALDAVFAEKPDFQWYSTDHRVGQAAKRRDTLIPYFERRHSKGERLGLARFRFTGNSPRYGNFEMTMRRSIPSVRGGRWLPVPGKGAAVCEGGSIRLIVMSFGRVPGG